ncbi:hypothetical protein ACPV54_10725 [Vibrio mediterranei]
MKLINTIPAALIVTSFGVGAITIDGELDDWGKLALDQASESLALKNEDQNIIFAFKQLSNDIYVPVINEDITTFIPIRKPVILWLDADNDPSTQIYDNHFSKGAEVIFSNINDIEGEVYYNGRIYKNGENGVIIRSNSNHTVYEALIPKTLIGKHINLLDEPRIWFTYESQENGKLSPFKARYSNRVTSFSANFNPVAETYDDSGRITSYSSVPGNMYGMSVSQIQNYAALAAAVEKVESVDKAIEGGGVIGVSIISGEVLLGGLSVGIYEDRNGYGLYGEVEGGPSGLNLQVDGFYAPNSTIEDVEEWSVNVKTVGQIPGRFDISTGVPIRNDGLLGRGSTINAELTILGVDLNVPNLTTVTYMQAVQLLPKEEPQGSNDSSTGDSDRNSGSSNNGGGSSGGGTSTNPPGNGPNSGRGPGGYTPMD